MRAGSIRMGEGRVDVGRSQLDGEGSRSCNRMGDVALLLCAWVLFGLGPSNAADELLIFRRLLCGLRGLSARWCGGRRVKLARCSPGAGCNRRRKRKGRPVVVSGEVLSGVLSRFAEMEYQEMEAGWPQQDHEKNALFGYEFHKKLSPGSATLAQVDMSSAGRCVWSRFGKKKARELRKAAAERKRQGQVTEHKSGAESQRRERWGQRPEWMR